MLVLGLVLICCMTYSNGEIAMKTQKNELPKERRKIVKLLLRNFPLQESASYHNLVEDDETGQPIPRGSSMTKYAPAYPYEEESMSELNSQKPVAKLLLKLPDISKFEYALSTILLPPPVSQSQTQRNNEDDAEIYYAPYMGSNVKDEDMFENSDENPEIFYEPYMQNMYQNDEYFPENSANNADAYYASYTKQPYDSSDPEEEFADEYYIPYYNQLLNYNQQQVPDQYVQYFHRQPHPIMHEEYQDLPQHDVTSLYEGPVDDLIMSEKERLPHENEIFDVPRIILKLNQ